MRIGLPFCPLAAAIVVSLPVVAAAGWRSEMFPPNWVPLDEEIVDGVNRFWDERGTLTLHGERVQEGHPDYHPYRFLHDFSYAGYAQGLRPIPPEDPEWRDPPVVLDVTQPPYHCVPDGASYHDCAPGIQQAILDAEAAGGGVVLLPAGEYRLVSRSSAHFLRISRGGVILRGEGPDRTRLLVDPFRDGSPSMYRKSVIDVVGGNTWLDDSKRAVGRTPITRDLPFPTRVIPVGSVGLFQILGVGASVAIVGKRTDAFLEEHDMVGTWSTFRPAYLFRRKVVSVDPASGTITVDVPTRYRVRLSDEPEVVVLPPGISGVGLEGFSIGMIRHPDPWEFSGDIELARDRRRPQIIHDLWQTRAIRLLNVSDSWIHDLRSYRPLENAGRPAENALTGKRYGGYDVEILNEVLSLESSRNVTVKDLWFKNAQVDAGSANGYAVRVSGSDNLLEDVTMEKTKKGFAIMDSWANGNVIKDSTTRDPLDACDLLHWDLSAANLIDNHTLEGGWWSAIIQGVDEVGQGHSSSESVFWNTRGLRRPDTGIKVVDDRDNDGDSIPDVLEAHGDLPDVALVISNQYGWGYVIGTHGPFSDVLTPRFERQMDGDWSRPHVFPADHAEGIGYDPATDGSLEPRSLYEGQLALRLRRLGLWRNVSPTARILWLFPRLASSDAAVTFQGAGADPDGVIEAYHWHSSLDGTLSTKAKFSMRGLRPGVHRISLSVRDDQGAWSVAEEATIRVERGTPPEPIIVDDGATGTVPFGDWRASTAADPWGASSVFSAQIGATYDFRPPRLDPGAYRVSLRWTVMPGRRSRVPVRVEHARGTSWVEVDQTRNGSTWYPLGVWDFAASGSVRLVALGQGATCADAVRFERLRPPGASVSPSSSEAPFVEKAPARPSSPGSP